jgi:hypothetical protein
VTNNQEAKTVMVVRKVRHERRLMARADLEALNADYNNFGIPRNVTDLLAIDDDLLHEKMIVDSRCDAELLTAECFEREGKLLRKISKKSHMLEVGCSNKECQDLRVVWRRMQTTGKWKLSKFVWVHSCGNKVIPASVNFGSTAYSWQQLVGLIVPLVAMDPSVSLKAVKQEIQPYLKREVLPSLLGNLKKGHTRLFMETPSRK